MRRLITPESWQAALEQVRALPDTRRSALRVILDAIEAGQARLDIGLQRSEPSR
jgi:hypothetical protein